MTLSKCDGGTPCRIWGNRPVAVRKVGIIFLLFFDDSFERPGTFNVTCQGVEEGRHRSRVFFRRFNFRRRLPNFFRLFFLRFLFCFLRLLLFLRRLPFLLLRFFFLLSFLRRFLFLFLFFFLFLFLFLLLRFLFRFLFLFIFRLFRRRLRLTAALTDRDRTWNVGTVDDKREVSGRFKSTPTDRGRLLTVAIGERSLCSTAA